jgi:hypothetical protein
MSFLASGYKTYLNKAGTANTAFAALVEPMRGCAAYIARLQVNTGNTAAVFTIMRPLNLATVTAAVAANTAAAVVTLAADPGVYSAKGTFQTADNAIAPGDYVAFQISDGTYLFDVANTNTAGTSLVLTTTLPATCGIAVGAPVWFYGISTDKNPADGQPHPVFLATTVNTAQQLLGGQSGDAESLGVGSFGHYEPLIVYTPNTTGNSTINQISAVYVTRTGPNKSLAATG